MPLFFESFGDYKTPLYIYEVAIAQLIFGPTDFSERIPAVVVGSLSIPIFYFLAKELLRDSKNQLLKTYVPYLSAFLLATSPWHIQFTRAGFAACLIVFFYALALLLFFAAMRKSSTLMLTCSMVTYVLTLYSYYSPRIITPIVLFFLIIFYFKKFPIQSWIKALLVAGVLAFPVIAFALTPEGMTRARTISIFYQPTQYPLIKQFILNYFANISPYYLFVKGDPTIAHLTPYRMSLIHAVEFPFLILGMLKLIKMTSRKSFLILITFFIGFIPPAITITHPHALRAVAVLPASIFISALGFGYFLSSLKKEIIVKSFLAIYLLSISLLTVRFLYIYHSKYVIDAGWDWQVGIKKASLRVLEIEHNYKDVYFDVDPRLIPVVWYLKIDPRLYQKSVIKTHLSKFHINENISSVHGLYIGLQPPQGKLLEYVYYPNNSIAYGIWEF